MLIYEEISLYLLYAQLIVLSNKKIVFILLFFFDHTKIRLLRIFSKDEDVPKPKIIRKRQRDIHFFIKTHGTMMLSN